ncbi:MAG: DUF4835 family protein [Fidelibacterota bacterium]
MKINPIYRNTFLLLLWLSFVLCQFSEATVSMDTRMLRGNTEDALVKFLSEQIESYFETTIFSPEVQDLGLSVDIQIIIEGITISGSNKIVSGQALFSNMIDQQYFTKGFEFKYRQGESINFSQMYDPTASFFDYFAFLFIAAELDTYDELGGNLFYIKAIDISESGRMSSYSRGWDNRLKKVKEIKDNLDLRRAKYYFFQAYDLRALPKVQFSELQQALKNFYNSLEISIYKNGNDRNTEPFLKAYALEISTMFKEVNMTVELKSLIEMDPENREIYESVLKNKD